MRLWWWAISHSEKEGNGKVEVYHRRDPFPYTTLPSASTSMYQFMSLKPNIAALLPPGGILSALQSSPQWRDKLLWFYYPLSLHQQNKIIPSCAPPKLFLRILTPWQPVLGWWKQRSTHLIGSFSPESQWQAIFSLMLLLCWNLPGPLPPVMKNKPMWAPAVPGNWTRLCRRATGKFLQGFAWRGRSPFSNGIKLHLCQKQEASGYPVWCTDDNKKAKYVEDYRQREDVLLWAEHIKKSPAKCQIAKLFLNSLWGKFGQRSNLTNTTIVREPDELHCLPLFSGLWCVLL